MADVSFGIFDWIDRGSSPLDRLYEERLQLLEEADKAGFYSYHLAEHHFTPLGMAPSPALFLAAASQRTRNIRLGPLGCLLPLYNPLRLIEEVCMLDNLSKGRLDLGIGRGVSPYEVGYYGVDAEDSRDMLAEALTVLLTGLTQNHLTFQGKYYHYDDVPMELRPHQQPYPPIWYPTHNPESIVQAAQQGYNLVGLGPAAFVRSLVDAYWNAWEEHRQQPGRRNGHVTAPKVGVMRQVFVADTDDEALAAARPAHGDWFYSITKLWHDHNDHMPDGLFNWDVLTEHESLIFGSPDRVREQVARLLEVSGCNYVIFAFAWGTLTQEQKLRSLRLFAEEVMPAFAGVGARVS
jgi:alkanesulfonate monooxygenase SsuD/methylene tetrahydromethanopterin reductase-like flavin-dependent oxidoreductase (luciferase family)